MDIIDLKRKYKRYTNTAKISLSSVKQKITPSSKILKRIENPHIKKLYFEVTNICNAKCIFCAYRKVSDKPEYKKGIMDFKVFKKGADDYHEMGGRAISLTPTIGEALIDPGIFEKINYAVDVLKMKRVYFYTNGILLGKNGIYQKLIDSGIREIDISTSSFNKEIFEKVYGIPVYGQLLSGISSLLEYNKKKGEPAKITINFRSPEKPSRLLRQPDFNKYIKPYLSDRVSYTVLVDYDNWGGKVGQRDLIGDMRLKKTFSVQRTPCLRTFDASILYDGSVRLCACRIFETEFDDLVVGNIMEDKFKNIYFGARAKKIRRSFFDGTMPAVCCNCSLYDPGDFLYPNYIR